MTLIDFEKDSRGRVTFESFVAGYGPPDYGEAIHLAKSGADQFAIGIHLHIRVPDGCGFFGAEAEAAQWCHPKDWHRLYFAARKANQPSAYA